MEGICQTLVFVSFSKWRRHINVISRAGLTGLTRSDWSIYVKFSGYAVIMGVFIWYRMTFMPIESHPDFLLELCIGFCPWYQRKCHKRTSRTRTSSSRSLCGAEIFVPVRKLASATIGQFGVAKYFPYNPQNMSQHRDGRNTTFCALSYFKTFICNDGCSHFFFSSPYRRFVLQTEISGKCSLFWCLYVELFVLKTRFCCLFTFLFSFCRLFLIVSSILLIQVCKRSGAPGIVLSLRFFPTFQQSSPSMRICLYILIKYM